MTRHIGSARRVVAGQRNWPWGLVVFTDAQSTEVPPAEFDSAGVAAGSTVIVARILHEVDGSATAEVWVGDAPTATLTCLHDGTLALPSGRIVITDAAMSSVDEAAVPPGVYGTRLWVDSADFPELVVLCLTPAG